MYSTQGKRKKRAKGEVKATKPFRPPRKASQSVIPGLLKQTGTEKKVLFVGTSDPTNALLALNATGTITCLNLIAVGSSMFNRVGRRIEMTSVRFCGFLQTISGITRATISPDLGRIMIIYDRQTNGAFPSITDILQDTDQAGTNTTESQTGINMNNRERFVTIMDIKLTVPQATATAGVLTNVFPNGGDQAWHFDEFRKLRGLTTHYKADSATAVIGDISTGALYLLSFSTNFAAGNELFAINFNVRLKYVDV